MEYEYINRYIKKRKADLESMLHIIIIKLVHVLWILVPIPIYALYNQNYLDKKQAQLLITQAVLLLSLMLPGWIMHTIRFVGNGFYVFVLLDLCIIEYEEFIYRYESEQTKGMRRVTKKYNLIQGKQIFMISHYKTLKKFKLKETFIFPLFVLLWIIIKAVFTKVTSYGIGQELQDGSIFQGFLKTFDGWNCNFTQFYFIPVLWLGITIFCYWFTKSVIQCAKQDLTVDPKNFPQINGYKIYVLHYLILPSIVVFIVQFIYNFFAHFGSSGLLQCYLYFKYGVFFYAIACIGIPFSIGFFFYMRGGRFLIQSENQGNSQVSNDQLQRERQENKQGTPV